jgi:small subunit ribosomal protein S17
MVSESKPRRKRATQVGHVVSRSGPKTIVVEVTRRVQDPFYKRHLNRRKKFHAHDERNECRIGDRVRIVETRPLSRLKRWRFVELLHRRAVEVLEDAAAAQPEASA